MAILNTQINTRSPEFAANRDAMFGQVETLRALLAKVSEGGGEKAQQRQHPRHRDSSNSSRPISQRRISLVPAPIS